MNLFARGGYVGELELRFQPYGRPGTAKLGVWLTSTFAGSYNEAVGLALATGQSAADTVVQTRQGRTKYGYYLNLQQEISDDLGLFARWSWNDGRTEIGAFTDIDASLSLGGLGVLVGDGRLSYAAEGVLEAYYGVQLTKGLIATLDYQLLINPAYNTDRGPVHLIAGRLSARY